MRLVELEISNFKALTCFALERIGGAVVLAGPNGCGKSCVLDGIRLLKSAYGGYNPNEWQNWMTEFQINFQQRPQDLMRLLQDPEKELRISGKFTFEESEVAHIRDNALGLLTEAAWREVVPELAGRRSLATTSFAAQHRAHGPEVERRAEQGFEEILEELARTAHSATITISSLGIGMVDPSRVLELAFASYDPKSIGVMEFFSANRLYNRETVGGVNLDLTGVEDQRRQSALYNPQNKYTGLKTEMASALVRQLLAEKAGDTAQADEEASLIQTLQELFATFFPGKTFVGPRATSDGRIDFPVQLQDGSEHDLDELSSGEKEVLYGYLRLRNTAPANSVILLDEPELHLNPRLIRGLARFYYNNLVAGHGNQLWLISHSDTLLREAVNLESFDVYHMRLGDRSQPTVNQATLVAPGDELERLVIDLVGDLAAYRPGAKVVLFEGGGDVEFDVRMVARLFPEFDAAVNAIAAGAKQRVEALHDILERVGRGTLGARFYAIRDSDSDPSAVTDEGARLFNWDVYHIENYLLEPEFILRALSEISSADSSLNTVAKVEAALKACAARTVGPLVRHRIVTDVDTALVGALKVRGDPSQAAVAPSVSESVEAAVARVGSLAAGDLSLTKLEKLERDVKNQIERQLKLKTSPWKKKYRGRDILKQFANLHTGVSFEVLRDSILARMKDSSYQPAGMAKVLNAILEDEFPGGT